MIGGRNSALLTRSLTDKLLSVLRLDFGLTFWLAAKGNVTDSARTYANPSLKAANAASGGGRKIQFYNHPMGASNEDLAEA